MAFSSLEKAMAAIIGIDILAPGTTRKVASRLVMGAATRAPPVAAAALGIPGAPAAIGAGLGYPWDFPGRSTGVGCHCLLP